VLGVVELGEADDKARAVDGDEACDGEDGGEEE
jgi:hypothetical protein